LGIFSPNFTQLLFIPIYASAVLFPGSANLEQVLTTVIHGAVELTDPVGQKVCFAVLRKLVELWGVYTTHIPFH